MEYLQKFRIEQIAQWVTPDIGIKVQKTGEITLYTKV